ncbi:MAG: hypothetical protein Q9218_006161 [Villophora microphyllina]
MRYDSIVERFGGLEEQIKTEMVDLTEEVYKTADMIESVEAKVDNISSRIDGIGKSLESNLKNLNGRFDDVKTDASGRFHVLHNTTRNRLCTQGWEKIYYVSHYDHEGRQVIPAGLPHTVNDFWALKEPELFDLVHLLRAYEIEGSRWQEHDHQRRSVVVVRQHGPNIPDLEKAVLTYSYKAHRELALELGLDYDRIAASFAQDERLSRLQLEAQSIVQRHGAHDVANGVPVQEQPQARQETTGSHSQESVNQNLPGTTPSRSGTSHNKRSQQQASLEIEPRQTRSQNNQKRKRETEPTKTRSTTAKA